MSSDKYIHSDVEDKIYSYWEKNGLFKPLCNLSKFIERFLGTCCGAYIFLTFLVSEASSYIVLVSVPTLYKPLKLLVIISMISFEMLET